ncbi:MAG: CPXCG motif-containing cysteine-rich protein [Myxococcota bacterium]
MEETFFTCCHCWERVSILVDVSVDGLHQFVEDCEVCCNPMDFQVQVHCSRVVALTAEPTQ